MNAGYDYSLQAVVQEMTSQSGSCFRGRLVPGKSALQVCHFWSFLGSVLVSSKAGHWVLVLEALLRVFITNYDLPLVSSLALPGERYKVLCGCLPLDWAWRCLGEAIV